MFNFDNVSKYYHEDRPALQDISFTLEPGEMVSVVGRSGAGKTTLLRMMLGEVKPSEGNIYFEDVNIGELSKSELSGFRRRIGTVFQDFKLLPNKTAYENITFAMEAAGRSDDEIQSDTPQVLELVGLGDKLYNFPHQLSGGEMQRVAIARAIINQPDIIIADEPTGNLDPVNAQEVIDILKKIHQLGTTVLLTTHNKYIVDSLDKRVITLENGKIIRDEKKGKYIL